MNLQDPSFHVPNNGGGRLVPPYVWIGLSGPLWDQPCFTFLGTPSKSCTLAYQTCKLELELKLCVATPWRRCYVISWPELSPSNDYAHIATKFGTHQLCRQSWTSTVVNLKSWHPVVNFGIMFDPSKEKSWAVYLVCCMAGWGAIAQEIDPNAPRVGELVQSLAILATLIRSFRRKLNFDPV